MPTDNKSAGVTWYWYAFLGADQTGWDCNSTPASDLWRPKEEWSVPDQQRAMLPSPFRCPNGRYKRYSAESYFYNTSNYWTTESFQHWYRWKYNPRTGANEFHTWNLGENEVKQPSSKIYLTEAFTIENTYYYPSGTGSYWNITNVSEPPNVIGISLKDDVYKGRHKGMLNLVYYDGHVETKDTDEAMATRNRTSGNPWKPLQR